jgi:hypothetical protein
MNSLSGAVRPVIASVATICVFRIDIRELQYSPRFVFSSTMPQ